MYIGSYKLIVQPFVIPASEVPNTPEISQVVGVAIYRTYPLNEFFKGDLKLNVDDENIGNWCKGRMIWVAKSLDEMNVLMPDDDEDCDFSFLRAVFPSDVPNAQTHPAWYYSIFPSEVGNSSQGIKKLISFLKLHVEGNVIMYIWIVSFSLLLCTHVVIMMIC